MEIDLEKIRQIYLQKLSGKISEAEEAILAEAMSDSRVRKMCKELKELYESPEMLQLLKERPTSRRWDELLEVAMAVPEKAPARPYYRPVLIAASIMGAVFFGLLAWTNFVKPQQSINKMEAMNPGERLRDIRLTIGEKEMVSLTRPGSKLIGDVALETGGDMLRFEDRSHNNTNINTLEVPSQLTYTVYLSDGTKVEMNSKTKLRFPFTFGERSREVFVDGEAYFTVAADAQRPFFVKMRDGSSIQVLGTSFNINTYDEQMKASLVDGKIMAVTDKGQQVLTPSEEVIWKSGGAMVKGNFEEADRLSWKSGIYYFDNADITDIAGALDRVYGKDVVVENKALESFRFNAKMDKSATLDEFMESLHVAKGVNYRVEGDKLYMY